MLELQDFSKGGDAARRSVYRGGRSPLVTAKDDGERGESEDRHVPSTVASGVLGLRQHIVASRRYASLKELKEEIAQHEEMLRSLKDLHHMKEQTCIVVSIDDHGCASQVCRHIGSVYYGLLWMRYPVGFLASALLLYASLTGIIMSFFFYFINSIQKKGAIMFIGGLHIKIVFICLPLIIVLSSVVISQSLELFFDALGTTPLTKLRASILCTINTTPFLRANRFPSWEQQLFWMDVLLLLLLELYPLASMSLSTGGKVGGYFAGVCETAVMLTVLLIVGDVVILVRCRMSDEKVRNKVLEDQKMVKDVLYLYQMRLSPRRHIRQDYKYYAEVLRQALKRHPGPAPFEDNGQCNFANECNGQGLPEGGAGAACLEPEHGDDKHQQCGTGSGSLVVASRLTKTIHAKQTCWDRRDQMLAVTAAGLWSWVCIWMFCMVGYEEESPDKKVVRGAAITMFLSVIGLSLALKKRLGLQAMEGTGYSAVVLFIAIMMSVLLWFVSADQFADNDNPLMRWIDNPAPKTVLDRTWKKNPTVQPYPVCRLRWGTNLSVLDLAALSTLVYNNNCYSQGSNPIDSMLGVVFGNDRGAELKSCTPSTSKPRSITVHFPHDGEHGTTVVAVRGTSNSYDAYMDLDLYAQVQVLQLVDNCIMPILHIMPVYLTRALVDRWNPLRDTRDLANTIVQNLKDVVVQARAQNNNSEVVMTGHSLGGLFAAVVAAELGLDALVFSAPGTVFLNLSNMTSEPLEKYINVLPDHDLVPRVDWSVGVAQHIVCRDKTGEHMGPTNCHEIRKTACELWRICGDEPHNRDFTESCKDHVNNSFLGQHFPASRNGFWSFFMT